MELATAEGPRQLTAEAGAHLGGIDILIDNAASQTLVPDGALAITDADWLADLNACLLSAVRLDGELARHRRSIYHLSRLPRRQLPHRHKPTSSTEGCSPPSDPGAGQGPVMRVSAVRQGRHDELADSA